MQRAAQDDSHASDASLAAITDDGGISFITSQMPSPPPRSSSPTTLPAHRLQTSSDQKERLSLEQALDAPTSPQKTRVIATDGAESIDIHTDVGVPNEVLGAHKQSTPKVHQQRPPSLAAPTDGASLHSEIASETSLGDPRLSFMSSGSSTSATKTPVATSPPSMSPNASSSSSKMAPWAQNDESSLTAATMARKTTASPPMSLQRKRAVRPSASVASDSSDPPRPRPRLGSRKSSTNSISIVIGVRAPVLASEIQGSPLHRQASPFSMQRSTSALGSPPDMRLPSPPPRRSASAMTIRKTSMQPMTAALSPVEQFISQDTELTSAAPAKENKILSPPKQQFGRRHHRRAFVRFLSQLAAACSLLWMQVILPLLQMAIHAIMTTWATRAGSNRARHGGSEKQEVESPKIEADEACVPFAERFKYLICTSPLLNKTLNIASYATVKSALEVPLENPGQAPLSDDDGDAIPKSRVSPSIVTGPIGAGVVQDSFMGDRVIPHLAGVAMTTVGEVLCLALATSIGILLPLSHDVRTWARTSLLMASLVFGGVATVGVRKVENIEYGLSRKGVGSFSVSRKDPSKKSVKKATVFLAPLIQRRLADAVYSTTLHLLQAATDFDLACNKAISAIQEVELVSRGYKLTNPMPPISRIEAASLARSSVTGPFRAGRGARSSWQPGTFPSTPRSPTLSGGRIGSLKVQHNSPSIASALSPALDNTMSDDGSPLADSLHMRPANNYQQGELKMASLRKSLGSTFEEARYAMQKTFDELAPYLDPQEWKLLCEMYDVAADLPALVPSQDLSVSTESAVESSGPSPDLSFPQYGRPISPLINTEMGVKTGSPHRRTLSLLEDRASQGGPEARRTSVVAATAGGAQSSASPMRGARTRLSYISDRTPANNNESATGPNQNSASKRLSYIKSGSTASPLPNRIVSAGSRPPPVQTSWRRNSPVGAESASINAVASLVATRTDTQQGDAWTHLRLATLKSSFEDLHSVRRSLLCCLMALDFSLKRKVNVPEQGRLSFVSYWADITTKLESLVGIFAGLGTEIKSQTRQEMGLGLDDDKSNSQKGQLSDSIMQSLPNNKSANGSHADDDGVADRMQAMVLAMRSVQAKLRACSEELHFSTASASLHGFDTDRADRQMSPLISPISTTGSSTIPEAERTFETIRDDLLALSAEWESGLKILRSRRLCQSTSSRLSSTRLDSNDRGSVPSVSSPMRSLDEDDEEAMRQWITTHGEALDAADNSASEAIERQLARWSLEETKGTGLMVDGVTDHDELSALLLRSTSPQHLPPPGLEEVFQAEVEARPARTNGGPKLSREERIRLLREQRAAKAQEPEASPTPRQVSDGMMRELQAVMHNRKTSLFGEEAGQ